MAQKKWHKHGLKHTCPVCYASDKTEKSYIPPPVSLKSAEKTAEIIVNYSLFPRDAKAAFEYAVGIWERLIESPVPIYVQANWRTKNENVLGSCGPGDYEMNFEGAPRKNVYYPIAAVEKIMGEELTGPERPDMTADFNKNIDWYFGTDGETPDSLYDFASVVLHEIGHGLGFTGFFYVNNNSGGYAYWQQGDATSFDQLVVNFSGDQLVDTSQFTNPSVSLKNALVSNAINANSPVGFLNGGGYLPRLFAPRSWDSGSSIYHLNDATYPSSDPNSLMTHAVGKGEGIHDPGPVTMGIMADIGWKNMKIDFTPLKDKEEISELEFNVRIKSDFEIDSSSVWLVTSTDSFETQPDSIPLIAVDFNSFSANYLPKDSIDFLNYYISAGDKKNRSFKQPTEAPLEFFTMNFGPDDIKPEIEHEPLEYYFTNNNKLEINAVVEDNVGLDTVFVEYEINNVAQTPFGLVNQPGTENYSGIFNFNPNLLNDGDKIAYKIVARDASVSQNINRYPFKGKISFHVEKAFEPITGYVNNFDNSTADFILSDFDIYTETDFENGALHSPHPYPSPDMDDTEFNFSTILKYPVILEEEATMSFDEIVLVEPGSPGTQFGDFEFWDYVIVEGAKKGGNNWQPISNGYDSRSNSTWVENYNKVMQDMNSTTVGDPEWFVNRQINMLENGNFSAGDTIFIRFRLFSDPYAHGWGWTIDNLRIQTPVSSPLPVLSPGNISAFPNPFNNSFSVRVEPKEYIENLKIDVFNMFGQRIKTFSYEDIAGPFTAKINLENQPEGMYLLSIKENDKTIVSRKLIKNN